LAGAGCAGALAYGTEQPQGAPVEWRSGAGHARNNEIVVSHFVASVNFLIHNST
jgi:hypothetical protein